MTAYTLNLLDLLFTLHALSHGVVELNPLMRNVPLMVTYKVFVVGVLLHWLESREEPVARYGLHLVTVAYTAVNLWHIINIF